MPETLAQDTTGPEPPHLPTAVGRPSRRALAVGLALALVVGAGLVAVSWAGGWFGGAGAARAATAWPAKPPARVCGNKSILDGGPVTAPRGAVKVPAGDNRHVNFGRPATTYWFAPGVHTLGGGQYSQIIPARSSRFVGAPGAVLDGRRVNRYAFTGYARNVTIEHLTIQGFGPVGGNNNEGVVNHNAATGWTVRYNTIRHNAGAGLMIGSANVVTHNCITRNEQYGFNAYSPRGPVGITLDHNELSYNNTYDWEAKIEGCGCSGGGKFWSVTDATVTNNYVHHNHGVGFWADNNNRGFLFAHNYISDNADSAIVYETSYNAAIRRNTIVRNAHRTGPANPGFPTGAIYISESGSDRRVDTAYRHAFHINRNLLEDNWAGVVLWENADRYCGSPANTSTGECTLVNPSVVTAETCNSANIAEKPYVDDCRWRTQNVQVHDNVFRSSPERIRPSCTFDNGCGVTGLLSNYGTYPDWSPYHGAVAQKAITFQQGNSFHDNRYQGAWRFMPFEQGNLTRFAAWRARPYRQDRGSTWRAGTG